jgi:hypothetical protein
MHLMANRRKVAAKASIRLIRDLSLREPTLSCEMGSEDAVECVRPAAMIDPAGARSRALLEHDPEKCEAVFRKDHAQTRI